MVNNTIFVVLKPTAKKHVHGVTVK